MRKLNGITAAAVLVLFVLHGVLGALNLMDIAPVIIKALSCTMLALTGVHALISLVLSAGSVITAVRTRAPYFRQNRLFWARRLSGAAIMILVFFHMTAFGYMSDGAFRLAEFDALRLTAQLLLLLSVAVHIVTNVKPALITFGVRGLRPKAGDILFFVSAAMLFMAAGFIIYYIRWQL